MGCFPTQNKHLGCLLFMCCTYILHVNTKTFQVVSAVIAEQLAIDVNDVWARSNFTDLGANSLDIVSRVNKHTF
jgi:hypothetical protein